MTWHPGTITRALKDGPFRQAVVELAFNYIHQKYEHALDLRFTMPKMKYKGASVETQRVKGKKGAKIQVVETEMTDEERKLLEERELQEQRHREAMAEKEPEWKLYVDIEGCKDFESGDYWRKYLEEEAEQFAGDEADRWTSLAETFTLTE